MRSSHTVKSPPEEPVTRRLPSGENAQATRDPSFTPPHLKQSQAGGAEVLYVTVLFERTAAYDRTRPGDWCPQNKASDAVLRHILDGVQGVPKHQLKPGHEDQSRYNPHASSRSTGSH